MSVFVIAECGVNHNGSLGKARELIDAAKASFADAVKFQFFSAKKLNRPEIAHLELGQSEITALAWHAKEAGIEFMCTPFGIEEAAFLRPLVKRMKIASGCIHWFDLLRSVRDMPIILSTGMSTPKDIDAALKVLDDELTLSDVTLLHCTSAYPCPLPAVNLRAMDTLANLYHCPVGYSDHTQGITTAIAAAARDAAVIEKHLTLDRNAAGPDHSSSIEPNDFRTMVTAIRAVETVLGDGVKAPHECEFPVRRIWRD